MAIKLKQESKGQLITHDDPTIFQSWGFINEEPLYRQLALIEEKSTTFDKD